MGLAVTFINYIYSTIIYEATYNTFADSSQVTITVVVLRHAKTLDIPGHIYLVSFACFQVMVLRHEVICQSIDYTNQKVQCQI
jgi:hypothetical protein